MPTVTGLTAARMAEIEAASVVDGNVVGDNLVLTKNDGSTIFAGNVRGPAGPDTLEALQGGEVWLPLPSGNEDADTTAFLDAVADLTTQGGGTVKMRYSPQSNPYLIKQKVLFDSLNNLVGMGPYASTIKLTTAAARVSFRGNGGATGSFSIHGGTFTGPRVATVGLSVEVANQRSFRDIDVEFMAPGGDAVLLSGTQNSHFDTVRTYYVGGNGFGVTNSSGSNVFTNCGVRAFSGWAWSFRQTAQDPEGIGYNASLENIIIGGVYEGDNENAMHGPASGVIQHLAGLNTRFIRPVIAVNTVSTVVFVDIDPAFGNIDSSLNIDSPTMVGVSGVHTWFDLRRGGSVGLFGTLGLGGGLNLFKLDDISGVRWNCDYMDFPLNGNPAAGPTNFAVKSSGSVPASQLILRRRHRVMEQRVMDGMGPAFQIYDDDFTSALWIYANQIAMGSALDTILYRAAAGFWSMTRGLQFANPTAPASTPLSSFFLNSENGNKLSWKDGAGVVKEVTLT